MDRLASTLCDGKSVRQWAPRLSRRRSAATAIIRPTSAGSETGPRPQASGVKALIVVLKPATSRKTPAPPERAARTSDGSEAGGGSISNERLRWPVQAAAPATLSATQPAQTIASISELLASRLAPCSPVQATSPQAQS